jgi:hypothetical protein
VVGSVDGHGDRLLARGGGPAPRHARCLRVDLNYLTTFPQQQIRTARALNQIGRLTYAQADCDVLATFAETGDAWSPQLVKAVVAAGLIGLGIWALRN